ncbi:two pore potassium channel protein sup-9-like [Oratosquilla oratoria]|uniref:two pore potassium channel protein sup-9-like n=1 Tax=Oratosquilla oratoria TaxID=337810 RepID=UPI003F775023
MAIERGRGSSRRSHSTHTYVKPPFERIKDCCRFTIAFTFSNVGVCGLFVGYTIMGAFIFQAIEGPQENTTFAYVDKIRNETIQKLWNITVEYNVLYKTNWTSNVNQVVESYQREIISVIGEGWDGPDGKNGNQWSIEGGFLYSLTVITTIGYGHISPTTDIGKVATIIYTIFGMPVFLLYMANMGDILAKSLKWSYSKICMCKKKESKYDVSVVWRSADATLRDPAGPNYMQKPSTDEGDLGFPTDLEDEASIGSPSWQNSEHTDKTDVTGISIPITVSLFIMVALLYGGTMLFRRYENWDYLTSFYFCFISLTTIGFGDFVPGTDEDASDQGAELSFIYCSLYLIFGLALLSMCFNLMQEEVIHKITSCLKAIRLFRRKDSDEEG